MALAGGAWLGAARADAQALVTQPADALPAGCPSSALDLYNPGAAQPGLIASKSPGSVLCEYARVNYTGFNLIGKYASGWSKRKIVYVSTNSYGARIAVTGTVVSPKSAGSVRDVVAYAPSTVGLADKCAQSAAIDTNITRSVANNGINQILDTGRAVVVPDYEGLGTTDDHPYLDGISSGQVTLDLLRAARGLGSMNLAPGQTPRHFMMGNSQGAQAVAWASQLAPSYAPELPLKGAMAVATPVDLGASLMSVVTLHGPNAARSVGVMLMPFALQGVSYYEPRIDAFSTPTMPKTFEASAWKSSALRNCTYENLGYLNTDPLDYWKPPASMFDLNDPYAGTLAARVDRFRLGQQASAVPFVLVHGSDDDVAPHYFASYLFGAWCSQGAPAVALHTVLGGTHISKSPGVMAENFDRWFTQLASGNTLYTSSSADSRVDVCQN